MYIEWRYSGCPLFDVLRKLVRVSYQMSKVYQLMLTLLNPNKPGGLKFDKLVTTVKKCFITFCHVLLPHLHNPKIKLIKIVIVYFVAGFNMYVC